MKKIGTEIKCKLCGKSIIRDASRREYCSEKCYPKSGKLKCTSCGKTKPISEFYDYRDGSGDTQSQLIKRCKLCLRKVSTPKPLKLRKRKCKICGQWFKPVMRKNTVCKNPECKKENTRRCCAKWRKEFEKQS